MVAYPDQVWDKRPLRALRPGRIPIITAKPRKWGQTTRFYAGVVVYGLICLIWSLIAACLYPLLPRERGARIGQWGIKTGFGFYLWLMQAIGLFRCDLSALDALRDDGALVIAPNHPTLIDAVLIISRLPRVVCISKASLWDNPFLGGGMRLAGYIRNDTPLPLIKASVRALAQRQQLLIFPEGSRTEVPPVDRFKGGFALIARQAGVPVQTVFLEPDTPYLTKHWPLFRNPNRFPFVYRARLGKRFEVPADLRGFLVELQAYFQQELAASRSEP